MNYAYIINPINNKKCKISSSSGHLVIKKYIERLETLNQKGGNKSFCSKLRKYKPPPCESHRNCKWVKHKGCFNKTESVNPNELPKIKKIVGPIKLCYWEIECPNKTKKKILFLNDEHTTVKSICSDKKGYNCFDIDDVLDLIINKADKEKKCIDLFMETSPKRVSGPSYLRGGKLSKKMDVIDYLNNKYRECAWHSRKKDLAIYDCQYKNLRFHNLDLRRSMIKNRGSQRNKLDSLLYYTTSAINYVHDRDYSILADYILGVTIKKQNKDKLIKILNAIKNSNKSNLHPNTPISKKTYTIKQIMTEMGSFRRIIRKEYNKFLKTKKKYLPILDLRKLVKDTVSDNFKKKGNSFTEYTHLFTDLYVLSRIFMEFSINKDKVSRSPENCPIVKNNKKTIDISPNRIILIAGSDHIDLYNDILTKYFPGNKSKIYETNENSGKLLSYTSVYPAVKSFTELFDKFLE